MLMLMLTFTDHCSGPCRALSRVCACVRVCVCV